MSIKNKMEVTTAKTDAARKPGRQNPEQPADINMEFTEAELAALSNGILSLIEKTAQARILIPDEKVHMAIDEYYTKLQALNTKICCCK